VEETIERRRISICRFFGLGRARDRPHGNGDDDPAPTTIAKTQDGPHACSGISRGVGRGVRGRAD